ncbi:MAG: hypothetical protein HC898_02745 [Phycisphaerales bacterium]|nr:hypothetical protein [Phycisphaerales bacterium]
MRLNLKALALCSGLLVCLPVMAEEATAPKPQSATTATSSAASAEDVRKAVETMSYVIGMQLGTDMSQQHVALDPALVAKGVADALAGKPMEYKEEEIRAAAMLLRQSAQEKIMSLSSKNKTDGEAFLAKNKSAEGVKTTASGLAIQSAQGWRWQRQTANRQRSGDGALQRNNCWMARNLTAAQTRPACDVPAGWGHQRLDRRLAAHACG